jgi:DNA modification methylase
MKTSHKVIIGDARAMREIDDSSVHLVVTSPPYWQLKDYGNPAQIGFNHTYEDYINNLNLVWKECYRVTDKGCRLCVNVGDQFARSVYYGRYKIIPIRTEIIRFCETIGFDYMGAVIWRKVTTCNTTGGAAVMGSYPYPRNGILKLDYEFILIFKKPGLSKPVSAEQKAKSRLTAQEWNEYFSGHWNFPGERQDKHLAMFPEELPKRLVKMFTFVGDLVLDPFLGSGTTTLAAMKTERNSIGYEINDEFLDTIKEKIGYRRGSLFHKVDFEFVKQERPFSNFPEEIKRMPYIFRDPIKFDKKVDPRKLQFGSRIDRSSKKSQDFYTVKAIVSPEVLELDNDMTIRLIGVKHEGAENGRAMEYLARKIKGHKVFMKFDFVKYDDKNRLLCYLYLRNKTFVNAHLIKTGLVDVDTEREYKYKSKFMALKEAAVRG